MYKLKRKIRLLLSGYSKIRLATSLSDNQIYPDFCIKASTDSRVFNTFRRNFFYRQVLEHVDFNLGLQYLEEIKKHSEILKNIELFKQNDWWGNAEIFEYPQIGNICPSTLRYIKVYGDMIAAFKNLDGLKVCEIGVGYGGQCRIINATSFPSEYILVDIKPALLLAQTYLDKFSLNTTLKFKTMNELEVAKYDLVISNYAFTELPGNIQDIYLKKVILNASRGYITFNKITPDSFNSYTKEELLAMIPNARIIDEKPLTHKDNCIIVWGV